MILRVGRHAVKNSPPLDAPAIERIYLALTANTEPKPRRARAKFRSLNRQFHRLADLAGNLEDNIDATGRGRLRDHHVHLVEADETGRQA